MQKARSVVKQHSVLLSVLYRTAESGFPALRQGHRSSTNKHQSIYSYDSAGLDAVSEHISIYKEATIMSQNNSNEKAAMLAKIETIHQVDGFDPTPFAVDYTDLGTGGA